MISHSFRSIFHLLNVLFYHTTAISDTELNGHAFHSISAGNDGMNAWENAYLMRFRAPETAWTALIQTKHCVFKSCCEVLMRRMHDGYYENAICGLKQLHRLSITVSYWDGRLSNQSNLWLCILDFILHVFYELISCINLPNIWIPHTARWHSSFTI